ncbi:MAG: hypothetical protein GYA23_03540, partial [Methanomicrobiales archaeon]|nr:hypothetical protein [Methanomicrobiales archaeon]
MKHGLRIPLAVLGILSVACLCGTVGAASLGTEWKERPYTDAPFNGVKFSSNGTFVFAGGDQLVLRTWDGQNKWGGRAGSIAMMSDDGAYVVTGIGQSVIYLDRSMKDLWSTNMGWPVKAVAI